MALALLILSGWKGLCQGVILHLRTGDILRGTILSEDAQNLVLSNSWNPKLILPLATIQSREAIAQTNPPAPLPPPAAAVPVAAPAPPKEAPKTPPPKAKPPKLVTPSEWTYDISLGADLERGARDHQTISGRIQATYIHPYKTYPNRVLKSLLTYDAQYGKTGDFLSDNRMSGSSKLDADFTKDHFAYNLAEMGYDKVRLVNLRYEEGPGAGYHWLRKTNFVANLELGANYEVEQRADSTKKDSFYFRAAQDSYWKIRPELGLAEKFEYFSKSTDPLSFRVRFETTLSYTIIQNISLNLTLADIYDAETAIGIPRNDFQLRTTLGLKF